jgi:uncharacterized cofD-like protein
VANNLKITTIGGGTGSPTVIRSLVLSGFSDISAVSASTDSGGKTGQTRSDERDRVIAVSDLLRNLLALISPNQNQLSQVAAFTDLVSYTDGRNRNLGYTLYYALLEKYSGDFLAVQRTLEKLLNISFHGRAIPVTTDSANICFSTSLGVEFTGEHELDRQSMSTNTITKIWLNPSVSATKEAVSAIKNATHIIYSPGSIYGSIIANFLPTGITQALKHSRAKKILISNLVSNRNQTHRFTPKDYLQLFRRYTQLTKPFDFLICPDIPETKFDHKYPKIAATYASEHSHFLGWTKRELAQLTALGIKVIPADIFSITPHLNRIRHDPQKLSAVLKKIISSS